MPTVLVKWHVFGTVCGMCSKRWQLFNQGSWKGHMVEADYHLLQTCRPVIYACIYLNLTLPCEHIRLLGSRGNAGLWEYLYEDDIHTQMQF